MRIFISAIISFILGAAFGFHYSPREPAPAKEVLVLRRVDTVRISSPSPIYSQKVSSVATRLPTVTDSVVCPDSITVEVPIQQAVYHDSTYTAYVSGYRPSLDSLIFFRPITTEYAAVARSRKRFALGISAGYAATPHGFQPYLGIGITLKLWEF